MTSTNDYPAAWRQQWATLYWARSGPDLVSLSEIVNRFAPVLREWFQTSQLPFYYTGAVSVRVVLSDDGGYEAFEIADGPFDGRLARPGDRYVVAIKWNLQSRTGGPVAPLLRGGARETIRQALPSNLGFSLNAAGAPITGDRGVPETPAIPAPPEGTERSSAPVWPWLLGAAGFVYLASQK